MRELYIGLMSGTSIDGIDAALVDFADGKTKLVNSFYAAYPDHLRKEILSLCHPGENEIERLGELDRKLGILFAEATNALLKKQKISANAIKAIGSHGQTIRHAAYRRRLSYTLQIGDPNTIATLTGITTVADFRRKDIALGGQGAPLVPAFHRYLFPHPQETDRAVVNIGGIANVTLIFKENVYGFDTGPGNVLMDAWIYQHQQKPYDDEGCWAREGKVDESLLSAMLDDDYFRQQPPKSTGREYFNLNWLTRIHQSFAKPCAAIDVQATLLELTARSIVDAIVSEMSTGEIIMCGGGSSNRQLIKRIQKLAGSKYTVATTQQYGIDPQWVEAMAFAWLAYRTLGKMSGNLMSVTGASKAAILGAIHYV